MQLRTRLFVSGLAIMLIVIGLIGFVIWERQHASAATQRLANLHIAEKHARELSLYVQYNAHDTNAYTLGHLEHREEFAEHAAAFSALVEVFEQQVPTGLLDTHSQAYLAQIQRTRNEYNAAAQALFAAADANRTAPSAMNQEQQEAAWERTDVLGDQLDEESQQLASHLNHHAQLIQDDLAARTRRFLPLVLGVGLAILLLIAGILGFSARALGAPLQTLLRAVQRVAEGHLDTQADIQRRDEIGTLATAFNAMTQQLHTHYAVAQQARTDAEAAQAEVLAQLQTIELQNAAIRKMSVPILPLTHQMLVMPLVGALDTTRLAMLQNQALQHLQHSKARYLILDVTGVPIIDTQVARGLMMVVQSARLLGAEVMLVGIRPELAQTIVGLGISLEGIMTRSTLENGVTHLLQYQ
jgi:rsbT co-antagonist protein RsbR